MATGGEGVNLTGITCPICFEVFKNPKRLGCGGDHIYCEGCLYQLALEYGGFKIVCPECREEVPVPGFRVSGFHTAHHIVRLTREIEDGAWVRREGGTVLRCALHDKELTDLYCKTCRKPVCVQCIADNLGHDYKPAADVIQPEKVSVNDSLEPARERLETARAALVRTNLAKEEIEDRGHHNAQRINETYEAMIADLQKQRDSLLALNDRVAARKLETLSAQIQSQEEIVGNLRVLVESIEDASRSMSVTEYLMRADEMKDSIREMVARSEEVRLEPVEADDVTVLLPDVNEMKKQTRKSSHLVIRADPKMCQLSSRELLRCEVRKVTNLQLQVRDYRGNHCMGKQEITCELRLDSNDSQRPVSICPSGRPSSYRILFTAETPGRHKLHIKVNGEHIARSPFRVMATLPPRKRVKFTSKVSASRPSGVAIASDGKILTVNRTRRVIDVFDDSVPFLSIRVPGEPGAIATDDQGFIYVTDIANRKLHKLTMDGQLVKSFGSSRQLRKPQAVRFDPIKRELYLCDVDKVWVLDVELRQLKRSLGGEVTKKPTDVAIDPAQDGNIFVADTKSHQILVFTRTGRQTQTYNVPTEGLRYSFARPKVEDYKMCFHRGHLYVIRCRSAVCHVFDSRGEILESFGHGRLSKPKGVAVDRKGHVCIADQKQDAVFVY